MLLYQLCEENLESFKGKAKENVKISPLIIRVAHISCRLLIKGPITSAALGYLAVWIQKQMWGGLTTSRSIYLHPDLFF